MPVAGQPIVSVLDEQLLPALTRIEQIAIRAFALQSAQSADSNHLLFSKYTRPAAPVIGAPTHSHHTR